MIVHIPKQVHDEKKLLVGNVCWLEPRPIYYPAGYKEPYIKGTICRPSWDLTRAPILTVMRKWRGAK